MSARPTAPGGGAPGAVLVTGGTSGIGLASARALALDGFPVAVMARRREGVERAVRELRAAAPGVRVTGHPGDVASPADVEAVAADAIARHGRLHGLVTCAAIGVIRDLLQTTPAEWDATFRIGVRGAALCSAAAGAHMRAQGGGRIVLVSSLSAALADRGSAAYCADKAAVESLARSLAVELAQDGVVANAVAPGWTRTPMTEAILPRGDELPRANPQGRIAEPDEIAGLVRWLVAEAPPFLTGATIAIDGGATARAPLG
jgi:NAD(P)-dependent dehydrogenase (short-subunit alcohol dehydrogenase family)